MGSIVVPAVYIELLKASSLFLTSKYQKTKFFMRRGNMLSNSRKAYWDNDLKDIMESNQ